MVLNSWPDYAALWENETRKKQRQKWLTKAKQGLRMEEHGLPSDASYSFYRGVAF